MSICALQGFSGTQGNPVKFSAKTFAVHKHYSRTIIFCSRLTHKRPIKELLVWKVGERTQFESVCNGAVTVNYLQFGKICHCSSSQEYFGLEAESFNIALHGI